MEMRLASTLKRPFSPLAASILRRDSFHRNDPRPEMLQSTSELPVLVVALVLLVAPELAVVLEVVALPVLVVQVLLILLQSSESVSAAPKNCLRWEPRNLSLAGLSGTGNVRFFWGPPRPWPWQRRRWEEHLITEWMVATMKISQRWYEGVQESAPLSST